MSWSLFTIAFILGYLTCKALYFFRTARLSLSILRVTHLISTAMLAKSMEDFHYARMFRMRHMAESGETEHNIDAFSIRTNQEIGHFKEKSIKNIIELHPRFFKHLLEFDDWDSAMRYLNKNEEVIIHFLKGAPNND